MGRYQGYGRYNMDCCECGKNYQDFCPPQKPCCDKPMPGGMKCNPCCELQELQGEVHNVGCIACNVYWQNQQIYAQTTNIENAITNPTYGLQAIQANVTGLQSILNDSTFGLQAIQAEITALQTSVEYIITLLES